MNTIKSVLTIVLLSVFAFAQAQNNARPTPDMANTKYGTHERNVMDVWLAKTGEKTPLVLYIHGGGFVNGSKDGLKASVIDEFLDADISVAAVNYRFIKHKPLPAAHHDVMRALQFIRFKAEEWKIDKEKIGAFGGSAGAQLSMWLAFRDEMAHPKSKDPIERESTRLYCVATNGAQATMDLDWWRANVPEFVDYRTTREQFYGELSKRGYKKAIKNISIINFISKDDPPVFMSYYMNPNDPVPENPKKAQGWKVHHVVFGIKMKEKLDKLGGEADLSYPGSDNKYKSRFEFLKAKLL